MSRIAYPPSLAMAVVDINLPVELIDWSKCRSSGREAVPMTLLEVALGVEIHEKFQRSHELHLLPFTMA